MSYDRNYRKSVFEPQSKTARTQVELQGEMWRRTAEIISRICPPIPASMPNDVMKVSFDGDKNEVRVELIPHIDTIIP
ncbi:hypothetical protein EAH88_11935 [Rhodanobacter glycinis]|uniref:Uncharacterized protein n=1 Tax=Rhodanobacter glycinis TaxID=582702 RepID=A0A502C6R2_9GAMM|nr:hypothetical protein [Rhodanobacter glycinis]TPG08334.1 hypothetical protein EAH88_11935 [Rhodanobacter glycinis]